jgi:hypothetical protein
VIVIDCTGSEFKKLSTNMGLNKCRFGLQPEGVREVCMWRDAWKGQLGWTCERRPIDVKREQSKIEVKQW